MVWSEEGYQRIITLITSVLGAIGDPGVLVENQDQRSAAQRFTGTVGAIGPGSLWDTGHLILYANAYHEVGAVNWPEGNKLALRLQ